MSIFPEEFEMSVTVFLLQKVPYENLHPIKTSEWQKSGYTLAEKLVRAVQLVDANVDISHFWGKHDGPEEEESYGI